MASKNMKDISNLLKNLKFRKKMFGGIDEKDVWRKLDELQEEYALDRTDFYVDLRTNIEEGSKYSEATRQKMIDLVQPFTAIFVCAALWILLHVITVKIGIAPKLFGNR